MATDDESLCAHVQRLDDNDEDDDDDDDNEGEGDNNKNDDGVVVVVGVVVIIVVRCGDSVCMRISLRMSGRGAGCGRVPGQVWSRSKQSVDRADRVAAPASGTGLVRTSHSDLRTEEKQN
jgi:hypothetical protein